MNSAVVWKALGCARMGPRPPACLYMKASSASESTAIERRGEALQEADGFDALIDDGHVQRPEAEEATPQHGLRSDQRRREHADHRGDGLTADPALDSEPSAGNDGPQNRRYVRAQRGRTAHARRRGRECRISRRHVRSAAWGMRTMRLPRQDRRDGLLPVHAAGDQARRKHIGGDLHGHGEPQRDVVVGAPVCAARVGWARGLRCRGAASCGTAEVMTMPSAMLAPLASIK